MTRYTEDFDTELSVIAPNLWCLLHREPLRESEAVRAAAKEELAELVGAARDALTWKPSLVVPRKEPA